MDVIGFLGDLVEIVFGELLGGNTSSHIGTQLAFPQGSHNGRTTWTIKLDFLLAQVVDETPGQRGRFVGKDPIQSPLHRVFWLWTKDSKDFCF